MSLKYFHYIFLCFRSEGASVNVPTPNTEGNDATLNVISLFIATLILHNLIRKCYSDKDNTTTYDFLLKTANIF